MSLLQPIQQAHTPEASRPRPAQRRFGRLSIIAAHQMTAGGYRPRRWKKPSGKYVKSPQYKTAVHRVTTRTHQCVFRRAARHFTACCSPTIMQPPRRCRLSWGDALGVRPPAPPVESLGSMLAAFWESGATRDRSTRLASLLEGLSVWRSLLSLCMLIHAHRSRRPSGLHPPVLPHSQSSLSTSTPAYYLGDTVTPLQR